MRLGKEDWEEAVVGVVDGLKSGDLRWQGS